MYFIPNDVWRTEKEVPLAFSTLRRVGAHLATGIAAFVFLFLCLPDSCADVRYQRIEIGGREYLLSNRRNFYQPGAVKFQADTLYKALTDVPEVRTFVYLVNSSRTVDVKNDVSAVPLVYTEIETDFDRSVTDYLRLNSLEDYAACFYTTDHHWNHHGSYLGYRQIVAMILGEDEPVLEPVESVTFPVKFNGSMNKTLNRRDSQEDFTVYRFEYPEMKIELNGNPRQKYGNQVAYFAGKYPRDPLSNHYNNFYGGEFGLVHFETDRTDRGDLLVYSNSMSDALDMLLASHFHHTYFVDPRHYQRAMGKPVCLKDAAEKWGVDYVLILGDGMYFQQKYHYH